MGNTLRQRLKQEGPLRSEQEAILNVFVANNFLKKKVDDVCLKHGITNAQYNVLRILKGALPDGYARCEIIPRMIDQAPDVTRILDNLEKQGLIARSAHVDDKRLSIARITKKGLDVLKKMEKDINTIPDFVAGKLTKEEILSLSSICEKLYE
jgi:DNA-binding MarR family transcriptional regulator